MSPDEKDADQADADMTARGSRQIDVPLSVVLGRYLETVDALRELHAAVASTGEELDTTRAAPEQLAAIDRLTPEQQALLQLIGSIIEGAPGELLAGEGDPGLSLAGAGGHA